jgi:hypothetical protein
MLALPDRKDDLTPKNKHNMARRAADWKDLLAASLSFPFLAVVCPAYQNNALLPIWLCGLVRHVKQIG